VSESVFNFLLVQHNYELNKFYAQNIHFIYYERLSQ